MRAKKISLDSRIFKKKRGDFKDEVNQRIANEVLKFNVFNARELIFEVASNKSLPLIFSPLYSNGRQHYDIFHLANNLDPENYIFWMLGLFFKHKTLISDFNELRLRLNNKVLKGDYNGAICQIELINKLSKSWWAIQLDLHIRKELGLEDTKAIIQNIPKFFKYADVSNKALELQVLSESSSVRVFIEELLGRMKEYRSSGIQQAIDSGALESCQYLPINLDIERNIKITSLKDLCFDSIIDQYVAFKEVLCELAIKDALPQSVSIRLEEFANLVNDKELLAILNPLNEETNERVLEILDFYTKGMYKKVIEEIQLLLVNESVLVFGLIEVYAKAKIYEDVVSTGNTFFDLLAKEFAYILQCDKKILERRDFLIKICVKFKAEMWAKSLNFHLLSALEKAMKDDEIEMARKATLALGELNTPKAKGYKPATQYEFLEGLPPHRLIKYANFKDHSFEVNKELFPVLSDFLKLKSQQLISEKLYLEAIRFSIKECFENNVSFFHLPMTKLCNLIEFIEKVDNDTFITCLIAYDIYLREKNTIFEDYKADLFEDFLIFNNTHRPSEIFRNKEINKETVYFLKNICIPSQLDNIISYSSNDDVIHERVAILDLLISQKFDEAGAFKQEKDSVLETIFSEKLRAKIESGKLFVDVQALESHRKHIYCFLFEQAKTTEGGIKLESLSSKNSSIDSDDIFEVSKGSSVAVASSKKTQLLYTIFETAAIDFALNEDFGLDKYLSAEIRHIVFSTQLRSCFEKTELVTSQKDGVYLDNNFWLNKYNYVNSQITQRIDESLKEFSKKVDDIIQKVNDRFKVKLYDKESNNIFDFMAYHHRLVTVSEIIQESKTEEEFFKKLLSFLWKIASESANNAKKLINEELAKEILDALSVLEYNINSIRGNAAVVDLMDNIKVARSLFTSEIELVLNWFRFVGSDDSQNFEKLGVVVESTMSSFDSIYGHKYKKPIFTQNKSYVMLNYREARSLFICLFTALENACKYSTQSEAVVVNQKVKANKDVIEISNIMSDLPNAESNEIIEREKSKWTPEYSNLNREEGGSGLYKIYSILSSTSPGFSFDIQVNKKIFTATIELKHENFSDRR